MTVDEPNGVSVPDLVFGAGQMALDLAGKQSADGTIGLVQGFVVLNDFVLNLWTPGHNDCFLQKVDMHSMLDELASMQPTLAAESSRQLSVTPPTERR
jgi:hypothetical protein